MSDKNDIVRKMIIIIAKKTRRADGEVDVVPAHTRQTSRGASDQLPRRGVGTVDANRRRRGVGDGCEEGVVSKYPGHGMAWEEQISVQFTN